jgi:hypothetical protein
MYVDSGNYTITVSGSGNYYDINPLSDVHGSDTFSYSSTIQVFDVSPQVTAGGPYYLSAPGLLTLNGSATEPSPADAALLTYQWILGEYPNGYSQPGVGSPINAYGSTPIIRFDHAGYYAGYLYAIEPGVASDAEFVEIYVGNNNYGTLNNDGPLNNFTGNTLNNYGTLNNYAGGELNNYGTLNNDGVLNNYAGGVLTNNGTLYNNVMLYNDIGGVLTNNGTLYNSTSLLNNGVITGSGHYIQTAGQTVNNGSIGQFSIEIEGGNWSGTGNLSAMYEYIGKYGNGTFTQTGGMNTVTETLFLGYYSGSSGTYELSGTGTLSAKNEYIGYYSSGDIKIKQTGGTNTVTENLFIGYYSGSSGSYELSGTGNLTAMNEYIGHSGIGFFWQPGGTNTVSNGLRVGTNAGSIGTYELSGTGKLSATFENIGVYGTGTFKQTGGTNTVTENLFLGYYSGSNGTYELSGTGKLSAMDEYIGFSGTGTFKQPGGTNTVSNGLRVGTNSGINGSYELSGTGNLSATFENIGVYGTGTFKQTGGTNTVAESLFLGYYSGSSGTYNLNAGSTTSSAVWVGVQGNGTLNQSDGSVITDRLILGSASGSTGTYNLSGASTLTTGTTIVGHYGEGIFEQSGGTNTISGNLIICNNSGCSGTYTLSDGTLTAANIINNDIFNYFGGTLNANITNNATGTVTLSGTGSRTVNGDITNYGTFKITSTNAYYTGSFTNYGAYISDPSINFFVDLTIGFDGYLFGEDGDVFSIGGNFLNNSTNSLWNTAFADLIFTGGSAHEYGGTGNRTTWDTLILGEGGTLLLRDGISLFVDEFLGFDPAKITGDGAIYFNRNNSANQYLLAYDQDGNGEIAFGRGARVSEPMPMLLLCLGLIGLAVIRRRMNVHGRG